MQTIKIPKKMLERLYVEQKLTADECSEILNCSNVTVLSKLRRYGIHIRTNSEAHRNKPRSYRRKPIAVEKLRKFYLDNKSSMVKCGQEFDCSNVTIKNRLMELGITIRDLSESHKQYKWPEKRKKKYSFVVTGRNNPSWIDGRSFLPYPVEFNRQLKELIRNRDNYQCQRCGCPEVENMEKLSIHHIDYNKDNCLPSNLISLCRSCNSTVSVNRGHWKQYFREMLSRYRKIEV